MICYLIRHGQQISHPGDPGLTDIGMQQAHEVGEFLLNKEIKTIISSPWKRTIETTKVISSVIGVHYSESQDLIERMNWNSNFRSYDQFLSEWYKSTSDRNYIPSNGNSSINTGKRIQKVISTLKNTSNIVLVTHGGAIGDFLRNIFPDDELKTLFKQTKWGDDYQIMHCSITKIEICIEPHLEFLNYTDHLTTITG